MQLELALYPKGSLREAVDAYLRERAEYVAEGDGECGKAAAHFRFCVKIFLAISPGREQQFEHAQGFAKLSRVESVRSAAKPKP